MLYRSTFASAYLIIVPLLSFNVVLASAGISPESSPEKQGDGKDANSAKREFAPGIRIDWDNLAVEVEAVVVLRNGPLELLACSPKTREHESILSINARPSRIFQAMGLIGLEPGTSYRYDNELNRSLPPTGESLSLQIRYREGHVKKLVPAKSWLLDKSTGVPPESLDWVFAGSRIWEKGVLGADVEGTIVCVVDFESALIALGSVHTADNEFLWLSANTPAIPPVGTPCTLIIRRASKPCEVVVIVGSDGRLRLAGVTLKPKEVTGLTRGIKSCPGRAKIVLEQVPGVPDKAMTVALASLLEAGIDRNSIVLRQSGGVSGNKDPGTAPDE